MASQARVSALREREAAGFERSVYRTSLGDVWVWARPWRGHDPLVLTICGAFALPSHMIALADHLDEDVAITHLPGMNSPLLAETSVQAFALALDEVLGQISRPVVTLGVSIGGLVALAMRSPWVRAAMALDPPLTGIPEALRPVLDTKRAENPADRPWCDAIFGPDYRPLLLDLPFPATVIVAVDAPASSPLPGLVSDADKLAYIESGVRVRSFMGVGHDLPNEAGGAVLMALREVLAAI